MEIILVILGILFVALLVHAFVLKRERICSSIAAMKSYPVPAAVKKAVNKALTKRMVYHLVPVKGGWAIKEEGKSDLVIQDRLKSVVFTKGRKLAKATGLGQLIVHGRNGRIQKEFTYGNDPVRSKG